MAMYQNAQRVNVEFLKSSTLKGRIIKLNYQAAQVPAQLYGRVDLARPTIFLAAPLKEDLVVSVPCRFCAHIQTLTVLGS